MSRRLVVVGGVAAGMSAAAKAARTDPDLDITVYERGPHISFGACGMPYYIAGDIPDYGDLIHRTPQQMAMQGVLVHTRHEVVSIDPASKTVNVRDFETGREVTQGYDLLVIATGARPHLPALPGRELDGVFTLRSLESGIAIQRYLEAHKPQRAVIVGGGYVGVEMAETFRRLGLNVRVVIRSGKVLRTTLDDDVRTLVEKEMANNDVTIVSDTPEAFQGEGCLEAIVSKDHRYPCDIALVAMGARPNVELARAAGIAVGTTGAIATDNEMRTSIPSIFSAGDCAETYNLVRGAPDYVPLGSTANKQGRVAGTNAGGGRETFDGVVGTMVIRVFGLAVARTGLSATQAQEAGYAVRDRMITASDIAGYFPGAEDIHVKLVADAETGRLLGGQIVGKRGVAKRVDVLAAALHQQMTISELRRLDLSYAPPFAPVWDPILVAANVTAKS